MKSARFSPTPTTWVLGGALVTFLLTPYLPAALLGLAVGNTPMVLVLLLVNLYVLKMNTTMGLAVFLAFASLFLENRRRTVGLIQEKLGGKGAGAPVQELTRGAPDLVPGEVHPERESPVIDEVGFEPSDQEQTAESWMDDSSVSEGKAPLETVPSNNSQGLAEGLRAQGFAS
jgi:hypothetical protein